MRYAVKDRPVEEFETELELPEWQLEPDEEWMFGAPDDEYYYVDEDGNLIEPIAPGERRATPFPPDGEDPPAPADPARRPDQRAPAPVPGRPAQPAASDDFLDRATGREQGTPQGGAAPAPRVP
jgi:penicillin-binding protein 1A